MAAAVVPARSASLPASVCAVTGVAAPDAAALLGLCDGVLTAAPTSDAAAPTRVSPAMLLATAVEGAAVGRRCHSGVFRLRESKAAWRLA